jgi:hypothetical protein
MFSNNQLIESDLRIISIDQAIQLVIEDGKNLLMARLKLIVILTLPELEDGVLELLVATLLEL